MTSSNPSESSTSALRVLLLPPTHRDAEAIQKVLAREGIACELCASMQAIAEGIDDGAGAVLVSEEALYAGHAMLSATLRTQPVWADLPVIVLSRSGAEAPALANILAKLGNVSVLERPVRTTTLVSIVRSALRARERQYQVRDHFTARERAEIALMYNREQLELVVRSANVGVWFCPLPFDRLEWDATVKSHFHLPPEANVTIDDFYDRVHPDDRDRVRESINASIASRETYDIDYRTVAPDGVAVKWIRAMGSTSYDLTGAPIRFSGITLDVTDRIRAQEELEASEERLQLAVQTGKLGVWELDLRTNEMACSAICKANCGRAADAPFTYQDLWEAIVPDDLERVREAVRVSIRDRVEYDIEYRNCWPDGSVHWVLARGRPVAGADGAPLKLIGVTLDITERRAVEEQRASLLEAERAARGEAERAGQMKDEFLATLSHELRTPLNAILGWSQILRLPSAKASDVQEGVTVIERNARAQAQIIEDLLDMNRIVSGKVRLEVQRLDLGAVVQSAIETVQPAAHAKEIHFRSLLDSSAPSISGDPNRLQQVFWNLLSNAVKFTPKGGEVQVVLARLESHLEVSVTDNGEGIAPAFLPHVFDRFRQANATTTRTHGGLGLGLSIVRQLVELHGGTIRVTSGGKDQGASFSVSLPVLAVGSWQSQHEVARRSKAVTVETVPHSATSLKGLKVLVVDDEADARALLRRLLKECDVQVHAAESALQAFGLVQSERPHVLISDVGMPGEDGYALIRRVRCLAADQGGSTPAVALTAYARAEDRINAITAGFQHHLAKPVEPAELIAIVASLAGRETIRDA